MKKSYDPKKSLDPRTHTCKKTVIYDIMPKDKKQKMNLNSSQNKETKISITMPTNAYFMSGIRDFTLNMIKNTTNFTEQWAFRFQSVVDELCNNAIEYGSQQGSEIGITFIYAKDDYLEITIEDTGTGKNKIKAEDLQKLYNSRKEVGYVFSGIRGRGLVKIVGEWSDELSFNDRPEGGISVKVRKYLKNVRQPNNGSPISNSANTLILNT